MFESFRSRSSYNIFWKRVPDWNNSNSKRIFSYIRFGHWHIKFKRVTTSAGIIKSKHIIKSYRAQTMNNIITHNQIKVHAALLKAIKI